jgi:hypothetical protein
MKNLLQSHYDSKTRTCTCTHKYEPPPCKNQENPNPDPTPETISKGDNKTIREPPDEETMSGLSYMSNISPWEILKAQTIFRLSKGRHMRDAKAAWRNMKHKVQNKPRTKRKLNTLTPIEDFQLDDLMQLVPDITKFRPSFRRFRNQPQKNTVLTQHGGLIADYPSPLEIFKRLENFARIYNYALFEPWCSLSFSTADKKTIRKCTEYWFTTWPFQTLINFDCNLTDN